ncbi:hypothetical protein OJAV_G00060050 [Oryzias javanicus]|uniref:Uncharacterized protein n=1 Tax=Oryzias javanicus TaxID=123683 RepID=A0A3S2PCX5_ORYJA|nr:hypothetical protein OJAV_G00060050 [Oryzias javanicus]
MGRRMIVALPSPVIEPPDCYFNLQDYLAERPEEAGRGARASGAEVRNYPGDGGGEDGEARPRKQHNMNLTFCWPLVPEPCEEESIPVVVCCSLITSPPVEDEAQTHTELLLPPPASPVGLFPAFRRPQRRVVLLETISVLESPVKISQWPAPPPPPPPRPFDVPGSHFSSRFKARTGPGLQKTGPN